MTGASNGSTVALNYVYNGAGELHERGNLTVTSVLLPRYDGDAIFT